MHSATTDVFQEIKNIFNGYREQVCRLIAKDLNNIANTVYAFSHEPLSYNSSAQENAKYYLLREICLGLNNDPAADMQRVRLIEEQLWFAPAREFKEPENMPFPYQIASGILHDIKSEIGKIKWQEYPDSEGKKEFYTILNEENPKGKSIVQNILLGEVSVFAKNDTESRIVETPEKGKLLVISEADARELHKIGIPGMPTAGPDRPR